MCQKMFKIFYYDQDLMVLYQTTLKNLWYNTKLYKKYRVTGTILL